MSKRSRARRQRRMCREYKWTGGILSARFATNRLTLDLVACLGKALWTLVGGRR